GLGDVSATGQGGVVQLVGQLEAVPVRDGSEELDVPDHVLIRPGDEEHALLLLPEPVVGELAPEAGFGHHPQWEEGTPVGDVDVGRPQVVQVALTNRAKTDYLTTQHGATSAASLLPGRPRVQPPAPLAL